MCIRDSYNSGEINENGVSENITLHNSSEDESIKLVEVSDEVASELYQAVILQALQFISSQIANSVQVSVASCSIKKGGETVACRKLMYSNIISRIETPLLFYKVFYELFFLIFFYFIIFF